MNGVTCMFCGWHRYPDQTKGGPPFDVVAAVTELVDHLEAEHFALWHQFLGFVANRIVI